MTRSYTFGKIFLVATILLMSCHPGPGDEGYVQWIEDYKNKMHVRHLQNSLAYDLQFQPSEYVSMQRHGSFDKKVFSQERGQLEQMQYFLLSISSRDGSKDVVKELAQANIEVSSQLQYYFSYRFQDDLSLQTESGIKPCSIFHYEQHGTKKFVLGFEKGNEIISDAVLTINSLILDNVPVNIRISTGQKAL